MQQRKKKTRIMKRTPLRTFDVKFQIVGLVCRLRSSWLGHDVSIDIHVKYKKTHNLRLKS